MSRPLRETSVTLTYLFPNRETLSFLLGRYRGDSRPSPGVPTLLSLLGLNENEDFVGTHSTRVGYSVRRTYPPRLRLGKGVEEVLPILQPP